MAECHISVLDHLVSRIIVSGAYLLFYLYFESQIWCMDASSNGGKLRTILGHCDLDL